MKYWKDLRVYVLILLLCNCIFTFIAGILACGKMESYSLQNHLDKWHISLYDLNLYYFLLLFIIMILFLLVTLVLCVRKKNKKDIGLILLLWLSPLAITMIVGLLLDKFI